MRKLLKYVLVAGGAVAALLVLLLIAAAIIIPIKYPPSKLKAMATDKLAAALDRKVTVGDVRFHILSGFEITQLTISNRPGWAPGNFLTADDISISYHLLPLLWGQVSLGQVELKNFKVLVERRAGNQFNFSDMGKGGASASESAPAPASPPASKPAPAKKGVKKAKPAKHKKTSALEEAPAPAGFSFAAPAWAGETAQTPDKSAMQVSVDGVRIVHGQMTYLDETVSPPRRSDLKDLNLTVSHISTTGGQTSFDLEAPFLYNKTDYHLTVAGSFRYYLSGQNLLDLHVQGKVNDLNFGVSGSVRSLTGDYAPDLDGTASLDMLKFAGLLPSSLSKMPEGLSLTGPAQVDFHLGGDAQNGLALSGTADGSKLALGYKDLFLKTADTTCKVEFKSVNQMAKNRYDLSSLKVTYGDWVVTGAFHYNNGAISGQMQSKSLPFGGLSSMIPKLKKASFTGSGSVDVALAKGAGNSPLNLNGRVSLRGVGVTLPGEPYLQDMTGDVNFTGNTIRVPGMGFSLFGGKGQAGVTYTLDSQAYTYALALRDVDAQKTIDASIDAYVTTKDYSAYKDKLFGKLDLSYAGSGHGLSGDSMIASQRGTGSYVLAQAKLKGFPVIKSINQYFKQSSDEIDFDKVTGNLGMKDKVFSYTADCVGKVGQARVVGGIDCVTLAYSPDMKVQCDIKKEFVNSDSVKSGLPGALQGQVKDLDWLADNQGNIPVDLKFTGVAAENHYSWDTGRIMKNVGNHLGSALKDQAQDLGKKLQGLFH